MKTQTKLIIVALIIFLVSLSLSLYFFGDGEGANGAFIKSDILNQTFEGLGSEPLVLPHASSNQAQ